MFISLTLPLNKNSLQLPLNKAAANDLPCSHTNPEQNWATILRERRKKRLAVYHDSCRQSRRHCRWLCQRNVECQIRSPTFDGPHLSRSQDLSRIQSEYLSGKRHHNPGRNNSWACINDVARKRRFFDLPLSLKNGCCIYIFTPCVTKVHTPLPLLAWRHLYMLLIDSIY